MLLRAIQAFPIPLPSLAEQEAIAGCLSSLDERITAQEGLVASLRQYKKGLMQGLFPVGHSDTGLTAEVAAA